MIDLWLVRHGQTEWNITGRFQGSSDIPLNALGRAQARAVGSRLNASDFDAIYASDLVRAYETAKIALADDADIIKDSRLQEIGFGKFEGYTWAQIKEAYPEEFAGWVNNRENNVHGGEKASDVIHRVQAFLDAIQTNHQDGGQILVVTHGGIVGMICAMLLGTNPHEWWRFRTGNTSITRFELHDRGAVLVFMNDDRHLETLTDINLS